MFLVALFGNILKQSAVMFVQLSISKLKFDSFSFIKYFNPLLSNGSDSKCNSSKWPYGSHGNSSAILFPMLQAAKVIRDNFHFCNPINWKNSSGISQFAKNNLFTG